MFDLNRLFDNWFADAQYSTTEKLNFAESTRDNVAAHNGGGEFDEVLPLLQTAFTAAGGSTGSEAVAVAVRMAAVKAKRTLLATIKDTISRRSGGVADQFGRDSVEYTEFFPMGVSDYRDMNETEVAGKLDVLIAAGTKYLPALAAEFTTFKTNWVATKKAAGDKISAAGAVGLSQDAAMTALELVLMKVIFTAALAFAGQPEMGPKLFDQSRLNNPAQAKTTTATTTTPAA